MTAGRLRLGAAHSPWYVDGGPDGRWLRYSDQDLPKAIKVTVRLFDVNKRIADGQVITMTFGLGSSQ